MKEPAGSSALAAVGALYIALVRAGILSPLAAANVVSCAGASLAELGEAGEPGR